MLGKTSSCWGSAPAGVKAVLEHPDTLGWVNTGCLGPGNRFGDSSPASLGFVGSFWPGPSLSHCKHTRWIWDKSSHPYSFGWLLSSAAGLVGSCRTAPGPERDYTNEAVVVGL